MELVQLKEAIKGLTLAQAATLVKELESELGVSAAAPVAVAAAGAPAAETGAEEKTEFSVILIDGGANRINVIKEVRAVTNLGLKEAKELVEAGGKSVKDGVSKKDAEEIKKKLEAAGAKVEIK